MDKYKETFETWDKIAVLYQDIFLNLPIYNDTYDQFISLINKEDLTILDVGCGPGNISKYILSKNSNFIIEGIDVSLNMISLAKKNNPKANFSILDARSLDSINKLYSGIITGFTLPYLSLSDTKQFIINSKNLLSENGILYLSFVIGDHNNSGFITGKDGSRVFFYFYDLNTIIKNLLINNFVILNKYEIPYERSNGTKEIHAVILARKTSPKTK
jgi:2-polyprenyl-3-methyl-5-hydroxy-6-metoxy-1,4-benzoquinol methylase